MKEFKDIIFVGEILLQSKIAQRAFERLGNSQNNFDQLEVWCSIQSILISTANISKILWPKKNKIRGERLRELLKVDANSILANRKFRNHFEHYDERIEEWFTNRPNGLYKDLAINPWPREGFDNNEHRGYNSFDNSIVFRGERLDLNKVLVALVEVHKNCKKYVLDYP